MNRTLIYSNHCVYVHPKVFTIWFLSNTTVKIKKLISRESCSKKTAEKCNGRVLTMNLPLI